MKKYIFYPDPEVLIKAMRKCGLVYNPSHSTEYRIVFDDYLNLFTEEYESWSEVYDRLVNVCFDDADFFESEIAPLIYYRKAETPPLIYWDVQTTN